MPLRYKIEILPALKAAGYSTYRLRNENLISQSTVQKLRTGQSIGWDNIEFLCKALNCQPGDILEYVPDDEWE